LTLFYIFIFGACFGSFLNVCIYRLPRELSVVKPRSFCPSCSKLIPWHDNVPIFSYLWLKGRCRFCRRRISFRYVFVELLTAILTVLIIDRGQTLGLDFVEILMRIILTYALIVVSMIDIDFYIIPNEISYSGLVIGLIYSLFHPAHLLQSNIGMSFLASIFGAVMGGGVLWLIGWLAKICMKKEAMGLGDVKLMAMVGAWLGWKAALVSILIASVLGSLVGIVFVVRKRLDLESKMPFGPFLSVAVFIYMMWGEALLSWYMKFLWDFKV